jgi:sirohydrochlorin cobaltochelatase
MEESPRIGDCYALARVPNLVMVPFFISDGLHSFEDIPVMLGEPESEVQARLRAGRPTFPSPVERNGKRVWYSQGIGTEPLLADVIVERVRELAELPPPVR